MDITYLAELSADIIYKVVVLAGQVLDNWVMGVGTLELTGRGYELVSNVVNTLVEAVDMIAKFLMA